MYLLTKTTQSLILRPASDDDVTWSVSWVEVSTTGPTIEEKSAVGVSSSSDDVELVPAPSSASIKHHVKSISIHTTTAVDVIVIFKEGSSESYLAIKTMANKFVLHYEDGHGWYLLTPT